MTKKIFVAIILLIVGLTAVYLTIFLVQNFSLNKSYSTENNVELNTEDTKFIRCNYSILKPTFAYTFPFSDKVHISFLKSSRLFRQTKAVWNTNETGGTTVKNTTFPQLVAMVKEDCGQFQQGGRKGEMEWIYSPAPTQEKADKDKIERLEYRFSGYGDRTKKAFIEVYGDIEQMSDEEKILLFDRIELEGLEATVDKSWQVDILLEDFAYMTESQRAAIRKRYGDWKGMSVDELFEWGTKLGQDMEEGKFNLEDY